SGVAATNNNAKALSELRLIAAREDSGERGSPARFGCDAESVPKHCLRASDPIVRHERDMINELLRNGKHDLPDATRRERIRSNTSCFGVDRLPGFEGLIESRCGKRFNGDDFCTAPVPRGHASDEATSTDRDQKS